MTYSQDAVELDPMYKLELQLSFVENTIAEVFSKATFADVFGASLNRLSECGCEYAPSHITWGSRVGQFCKITQSGWTEQCGARCTTPRDELALLMCPEGWREDCALGCMQPEFESTEARVAFLEKWVHEIVSKGYDYVVMNDEYTETCGCREGMNQIRYGTEIGFECVADSEEEVEGCGMWRYCLNEDEDTVLIHCPDGYAATCGGCERDDDLEAGDWMVTAMTGYVRTTRDLLDIFPRPEKVLDCGCVSGFTPIGYGTGIGHQCVIREEDIDEINSKGLCGPNEICINAEGDSVLHVCPEAFKPNCESGCGYFWQKEEL